MNKQKNQGLRISVVLTSALFAIAVATAPPAIASAGTYPMHQCSAGVPAVSPGWSAYGYSTLASTSLSNNCSAGGMLGDYVFSNGQPGAVTENGNGGSQVGLALSVPGSAPNVTIESVTAEILASSVTGDDAFLGFTSAGQSLPGAVELPYGNVADYKARDTWTLPQGARDWQAYVNCTTDHSSSTCNFNDSISVPAVSNMTLTLKDNTLPTISSVSGTLASAAASKSAAKGSQTLAFTGQDTDSGVISSTLTLTPQGGGSTYTHTFDFTGECTYDAWNACPLSHHVSGFNLDTAMLHDGNYAAVVSVTDAAGNVAEDSLGTITTQNAPTNTTLPTVLAPGQIVVGSTLSAKPGEWSAPSEAGNIAYTYQWEICDSKGENCRPMSGADNATYTTVSSDAEHALRVSVTAADNDGNETATSATTSPVTAPQSSLGAEPGPGTTNNTNNTTNNNSTTNQSSNTTTATRSGPVVAATTPAAMGMGAPNGTVASETAMIRLGTPEAIARSFAQRAFLLNGRLLNSQAEPISGATLEVLEQPAGSKNSKRILRAKTRSNGTFTLKIPTGASRTIIIGYRAWSGDSGYAAQASVKESVSASVQFSVTPQRTSSRGEIVLSGKVAGPIPKGGVRVELLVHYHGAWQPFRTPHTNANGRFRVAYKFQGASGRFPFRAAVPSGQAGFPFTEGASRLVNVSAN